MAARIVAVHIPQRGRKGGGKLPRSRSAASQGDNGFSFAEPLGFVCPFEGKRQGF